MSKFTRRKVILTASTAAALPLLPMSAFADETAAEGAKIVEMLNKHPDDSKKRYVFYPHVISVQPGETVVFKSVDRGHNSASIDEMLPEGVEEWDSKLNDDFEMTFDTPGFYGYKCTPHATVGMVGLVVVEGDGKLDNLEDAKGVRHRGKAKRVWEDIWEEAEAMGLLDATTA